MGVCWVESRRRGGKVTVMIRHHIQSILCRIRRAAVPDCAGFEVVQVLAWWGGCGNGVWGGMGEGESEGDGEEEVGE